jgi:L-2-hydroxyglutarate oxidase
MGGGHTEFLVIGGGVIGLSLALEARRRYPEARVILLEKETDCGLHASGRNSGVLHAGFYYAADSLKARFTRDGNQMWQQYCQERGLRIRRCGKLVVARNEQELPVLDELLRRARQNGVELVDISVTDARAIEPRVRTCQRALFSPSTAVVSPRDVMQSLVADARAQGVDVRTSAGCQTIHRTGNTWQVQTTTGATIETAYLINAAGLYADQIAHNCGFAQHLVVLPFKGLYLYSTEPTSALRTHVYPVPDLHNPFLGVHYTLTVDGKIKIGPTAIPAFWREHYTGLAGFQPREAAAILWREGQLWWRNEFGFRRLAWQELQKYRRTHMVQLASSLLDGVRPEHYRHWGAPGVRAQLLDTTTRRLVMDFYYEGDRTSFHVLNAVSPGFTCAIPFSRFLFDRIDDIIATTGNHVRDKVTK